MKVKKYSDYSKLYEAKLLECEFLKEQNITLSDIVDPLQDLINEEFIKKLFQKAAKGAAAVGKAVVNVAKNVANAVSNTFKSVFKFFGLDKLTKAISNYIKNTELFRKIKEGLSSLAKWAIGIGGVDENNKPNLKNIWTAITQKAKPVADEAGVNSGEIQKAGATLTQLKLESFAINEDDQYDISDSEVKYYGFFEKVAHALGIKNARFNGVVSQILKKGTIGLAIMGILKLAGLSLAGLTGLVTLGPVAMGVIGGMLLMAGLIILAIWICKPYPTLEDCLAYLHMHFGNKLQDVDIITIFINPAPEPTESEKWVKHKDIPDITRVDPAVSEKSLYPTMIKNLQALRGILLNQDNVKLQGQSELEKPGMPGKIAGKPQKPIDKKPIKRKDNVKEQYIITMSELLLEKDRLGKGANVEVTSQESYLTQAVQNTRKSLKALQDQKDKGFGITVEFIDDILENKMESSTKQPVKDLYKDIYEYLYGDKKRTLSELGVLYKESVDIISKSSSRQVIAEKMARFSKRTMQFEGEGFYSGLGKFGDYIEEYNNTLKQIMDYYKSKKNERLVHRFIQYKGL
jgi:hypothetical protein